jgi:hypothetical protein
MAMIAATTTTLRIFPDVANLPLRPPAVIAKAAATIDLLSGGRFDLGLGAGAFLDPIEAYGGPRRGAGESLDALEEAITVIRKVWSGDRNLRFDRVHYTAAGAQGGPAPSRPIGVWLGAYGLRALALTGRVADGWVPSPRGEVAELGPMVRRLDDAASAAGRQPSDLRRILNVSGRITGTRSEGAFDGPVDQWVAGLAELVVAYGFDTFVFWGEGDHSGAEASAAATPPRFSASRSSGVQQFLASSWCRAPLGRASCGRGGAALRFDQRHRGRRCSCGSLPHGSRRRARADTSRVGGASPELRGRGLGPRR